MNNNTIEEARVPEISGVSYQFNPNFFKDMDAKYGVKLENIVYYKNETHYFVMTALKSSLLELGVLKKVRCSCIINCSKRYETIWEWRGLL